MPGNRRGGGRSGKEAMPRTVQVSKKLAWLLRHGAESEGLQLGEGGYANLADVLNNRQLRSLKITLDEVRQVVQDNDKQRFSLVPAAPSTDENGSNILTSEDPKDYLIRANQGHSLKVEADGLLSPITVADMPETTVHGTTHSAWPLIVASGGLRTMKRNHVHFASGLPAGFKSIMEDGEAAMDAPPVVSGMRKSSTVLVFLDVAKAMEAGIKFWRSDNGVILSEGNADGLMPMEFFKRVEDRTGDGILVQDGKVVKEAPAKWAAKPKGKS